MTTKCAKCDPQFNSSENEYPIDRHHIIAKMDGGTDDPDNIIELCLACHKEWHSFECKYNLPFDQWLELPPGNWLAVWYHAIVKDILSAPAQVSIETLQRAIGQSLLAVVACSPN